MLGKIPEIKLNYNCPHLILETNQEAAPRQTEFLSMEDQLDVRYLKGKQK